MTFDIPIESIQFPNIRIAQTGSIAYKHLTDTKLYWYFTGMDYTNSSSDYFNDPSIAVNIYGLRLNAADMSCNVSGYVYHGIVIGY